MMPRKVKLTDAVANRSTLPEGRTEVVIWDREVSGFGLRVRRTTKTWIVYYRPVGAGRGVASKRYKLGTTQSIATAADARREARVVLGRIARGEDPALERSELRRAEKARVSDLIDAYEAYQKRRGRSQYRSVVSVIRRGLSSHLKRDIRELTPAMLVEIIDRLEQSGKKGAAKDFRARCRAFLSWCRDTRKVIDTNPLLEHRRERPTRIQQLEKGQHGKALSDEELGALWRSASQPSVYNRYVRFLILTGCRRTEASMVSRNMLDRIEGRDFLILPREITKNATSHRIPVSQQLRLLLTECIEDTRSDLYFPAPQTGGSMKGWSQLSAGLVRASGVKFAHHDLRRTFKTGLDALGVEPDISEMCLNHTRQGLEAIYNRNEALNEVASAFRLWADHVTRLGNPAAPDEEVPTPAAAFG